MSELSETGDESLVQPVKDPSEFQHIFDLLSTVCDVRVRIVDYPFRSRFIVCAAILGRISELGINQFCENAGYDHWFLYYHPGAVNEDQYSVNAGHYPLLRVATTKDVSRLTGALRKQYDEWLVSRLTVCFSHDLKWIICFDADLWFGVIAVTSPDLGTKILSDYVKFDLVYKCDHAIREVASMEHVDDLATRRELTEKVLSRYGDCDYTSFLPGKD